MSLPHLPSPPSSRGVSVSSSGSQRCGLDASTSLREEALRSAVGQIQTRFGTAALRQAAARVDSTGEVVEACPTGVVEIDELTGVGGIPVGRISLCLGAAGSGKML